MVETSDIYPLILGEEYGEPMPATDRAATEEEWTIARNLGKPTVVFEKAGISPGARQAAFIKKGQGLRGRRVAALLHRHRTCVGRCRAAARTGLQPPQDLRARHR
jgi:hypothetical protein